MEPTTSSNESAEIRTCDQWEDLFQRVNQYFRDEDILSGSEHSSVVLGYVIVIAYVLVIGFGIFGNSLTILAVVRNKQMRTVRNFFILNLALSDFFICTITAPITLYTVLYMFWPFGTTLCKIAGSLQGVNIFVSTFSITAIALDRYVLVIFPTKRRRQHNLSLLFFSLIWLISILLALPLFDASDLNLIFTDKTCGISLTICHEQNQKWQLMIISKETYTVGVLFIQYAFPLASMAFAYSRIAHRMGMRFAARNSLLPNVGQDALLNQRRKSIADRHRRTHLLLVSLVVVFAMAWLPLNIFHIVTTFNWVRRFSVPTFAFCHVTAIGSACLNPLSYAFFNHNFRAEFVAIFEKVGLMSLHDRLAGWTKRTAKNGNAQFGVRNGTTLCPQTIPPTTMVQPPTYEATSELDLKPSRTPRPSEVVVVTNTV